MKPQGYPALFLCLTLAACPLVDGLVVPPIIWSGKSATTRLFLAKKKRNTKKAGNSASGGFAATVKKNKSTNVGGDYAMFPALEPDVKGTLVASPDDPNNDPPRELPNEIYQRLDQIYGFSQFNYENSPVAEEEEEETTMSFQDLISGNLEEEDEDEDDNDTHQILSQLPPFEQFHVLHVDPLVISVQDFFTSEECDAYVDMPNLPDKEMFQTGSMTVGKDAKSKAQRTSTTWFNHYKNVPALMAKASRLLGLEGIDQWEEPQTVRYRRSEKFTWHLDALGPQELTSSKGGQRIATVLVYHTDLEENEGGATIFRDLRDKNGDRLKVQPKKGSALIFFPSAGGIPNQPLDIRTLHCGESVAESSQHDKWISQLWLRATRNAYQPTAPDGNTHAAATEAIADYCKAAA
ncbi:Probable prolyl 4-hydroxylase [Seminavis robusta]|uniref:Probable prolyl 4-hydroxylase n=1 Tax=Seminavis robusta TaxID=568900 RepID=A0A9N8EF65_9STRA|nr:Probable prolyl 4-hydroxylase [Seminavis robusta]|eukprot:Sro988_g228390.1 Probable prolyl 4-hydroxylase (407) ;mRNA; f:20837-22297